MFVCVKRKYVRVGELVLVIVNLYNFQKKVLFFAWLLVVQLLRYILIFKSTSSFYELQSKSRRY